MVREVSENDLKKCLKHSVGISPIFSLLKSAFQTDQGLSEKSIETLASAHPSPAQIRNDKFQSYHPGLYLRPNLSLKQRPQSYDARRPLSPHSIES